MTDRFVAGFLGNGEFYVLDKFTGQMYPFGSSESAVSGAQSLNEDPSNKRDFQWNRRLGYSEVFIPVELSSQVVRVDLPDAPVFSSATILESSIGISVKIRRPEDGETVIISLQAEGAEEPFEVPLTYREVVKAAAALLVAAGLDPSTTALPTTEDILTSKNTSLA